MGFSNWLHRDQPQWKINLESCHPTVFKELKMSREEVEKILEKLDEHQVLGNSYRKYN